MNNGETNTRDQRVVDAYRAASKALDERPQPATRAAILAAAARAVDAQPQDAGTGATSRRQAQRARSPIRPSRRPLALVASFLVATVVLAMVMRTQEQQDTTELATMAASEPAARRDPAAPPAQVAVAPAPAQAPVADQAGEAELKSEREGHGPTSSLATPGVAAADKIDAAPAERVPPPQVIVPAPEMNKRAPARVAAPAPSAPAPSAPAPSAPAPSAAVPSEERPQLRRELALADRSEPQAAAGRTRSNLAEQMVSKPAAIAAVPQGAPPPPAAPKVGQESRDTANRQALGARADERAAAEADAASDKLAKARPVERTAAIAGDSVEADPARWAERVIALRDTGRDDDADRELVRLRERYPDFKLPPNALRRAGTR